MVKLTDKKEEHCRMERGKEKMEKTNGRVYTGRREGW